MPRTSKIVIASAAAGAVALGVGIGIAGVASADPTSSPSANPSSSASADPGRPGIGTGGHRGGGGRGVASADLAKQLAEKLGIDQATVTKALEEIRAERQADRAEALKSPLDQAVKAGTLTQAEADAITKAVEKGVISGR